MCCKTSQTNWLALPGLSGPHRRQLRLTPIVSRSILSPATPRLQPFHSSLYNDKRRRPQLPLTTTMASPYHLMTTGTTTTPLSPHHLTTTGTMTTPLSPHHDLRESLFHHESPFFTTSQPMMTSLHCPTTCFHINITRRRFHRKQVCATVTWQHVSPKHPSWPMWLQLTPVVPRQQADHCRTTCINR